MRGRVSVWAFTCEQVHLFLSRGYNSPERGGDTSLCSTPVPQPQSVLRCSHSRLTTGLTPAARRLVRPLQSSPDVGSSWTLKAG